MKLAFLLLNYYIIKSRKQDYHLLIIQEAGLSEGDKITIIKVSKDNKTFFNIEHPEVPIKSVSKDQVNIVKENQRQLSTEQKVDIMWREYERNHPAPKNEDDIPF